MKPFCRGFVDWQDNILLCGKDYESVLVFFHLFSCTLKPYTVKVKGGIFGVWGPNKCHTTEFQALKMQPSDFLNSGTAFQVFYSFFRNCNRKLPRDHTRS